MYSNLTRGKSFRHLCSKFSNQNCKKCHRIAIKDAIIYDRVQSVYCNSKGAKEIHVYITHGVLSGDAAKKIKNSPIKKLVITDTIDNSKKINNVKNIEVLSISNLLGEALKRISNSTSVSDLFK